MKQYLEKFVPLTKNINITNHFTQQGTYSCSPKITKGTGKVDNSNNRYVVEMTVNVENTKEKPFPINFSITYVGFFTFNGGEEAEIFKWLNFEGAKMLYVELIKKVNEITSVVVGSPFNLLPDFPFKE